MSRTPVSGLSDTPTRIPSSVSLQVRTWSGDEFASSRELWEGLLSTSDADRLFMSWDWQWRWWTHHQAALGATLRLVAVYIGSTLVGLAPFYSRSVAVRGILRLCRMELIGTAWRHPRGVFSDYLDIIVGHGYRDAVLSALAEWLAEQAFWQELVLCCIKQDGVACQLARQHLTRMAFLREVDPLNAWCTRLPVRFEDFVGRLGSDVRRKLFNHRRKLPDLEVQYAAEAEIADFLHSLWQYSAERWGNSGPDAPFRNFHLEVAGCLARAGELRLSRLMTGERRPLSVMYNIRKGGTVYYLQSGFRPESSRGLSPGYLHFGYAIEAACGEQAERFDFLAGPGRHRDYKQDLLTENVPVVTYHAVRGVLGRLIYAAYESVKGTLHR